MLINTINQGFDSGMLSVPSKRHPIGRSQTPTLPGPDARPNARPVRQHAAHAAYPSALPTRSAQASCPAAIIAASVRVCRSTPISPALKAAFSSAIGPRAGIPESASSRRTIGMLTIA